MLKTNDQTRFPSISMIALIILFNKFNNTSLLLGWRENCIPLKDRTLGEQHDHFLYFCSASISATGFRAQMLKQHGVQMYMTTGSEKQLVGYLHKSTVHKSELVIDQDPFLFNLEPAAVLKEHSVRRRTLKNDELGDVILNQELRDAFQTVTFASKHRVKYPLLWQWVNDKTPEEIEEFVMLRWKMHRLNPAEWRHPNYRPGTNLF